MESLPAELVEKIFVFLNFEEMLIARNVSDEWATIIDNLIKLRPLWLKKIDENTHYYRFFGLDKIYENHEFHITDSLLSFRLCEDAHHLISKLVVYSPQFLVNLRLDNLEILEIKNNNPISRLYGLDLIDIMMEVVENRNAAELNQALNLKFKNLKTFSFKARTDLNITLDAEKLINVELRCDQQSIHIMNPRSVKNLSVLRLTSNLANFKNLTNLTLDTLNYKHAAGFNLFKNLTKLQEVSIWNVSRANFDKLIDQKKDSINKKLKIYYKAVDTSMNSFDFVTVDRISSSVLNENIYSNYVSMFDQVKEDFPHNILAIQSNLNVETKYFQKFVNIDCLLVRTHRISKNNWGNLLSRLRLDDMLISSSLLDQSLLDLLPRYCRKLQRLSVERFDNLNFVLQMPYLTNLTLHTFPDLKIVKQLIGTLKLLKVIKIYMNESNLNYTLLIDQDLIIFSCKDKIIFSDPKKCFLNSSIFAVQSWSDLMNMNGNAVCDRYKD